jgi:hypothetical protein
VHLFAWFIDAAGQPLFMHAHADMHARCLCLAFKTNLGCSLVVGAYFLRGLPFEQNVTLGGRSRRKLTSMASEQIARR